MAEIPNLVARDIDSAVRSAIQFGVDAETFLQFVRVIWKQSLSDKARTDDAIFAKATP